VIRESDAHDLGRRHAEECVLRDGIVDVKAVDWNRVWRSLRDRRRPVDRDAGFWDKRASSFDRTASETDYAEHFLAIMKPKAHWTVLDMGCGSGALAVPLAKKVSSVIAVDFSGGMLDVVRKRCDAEGIRNITTIHGRWEDDWGKLGIEDCDAAIASRSMVADDQRISILKLNAVARKYVYIVTFVGDGPYDRRLFDVIGRPLKPEPDYIYCYNLLYQMGILAEVTFIEEKRCRIFNSPEEAVASMKWMFDGLTIREEEKLISYFKECPACHADSRSLSYDRVIRWAVIWWGKK
jgi:SAM-dependent methyltransferase